MKKIQSYLIAILMFGIAITSCTEFLENETMNADTPPVASIEVSAVADSSFTLNISSDKAGYLGYVVVSDTTVSPTVLNILSGSLAGESSTVESEVYESESAGNVTLNITGLNPDQYYKVFCSATNSNGVQSNLASYLVKTDDNYGPSLASISPSRSLDAEQELDFEIVLTFDEPIGSVDASKFSFMYYSEDIEVEAGSVVINANNSMQVTVTQPKEALAGDYVFLSFELGAVNDLSGNPVSAMESGIVEGAAVGLYWRAENIAWNFDVSQIIPEAGSATSDLNFSVAIEADFPISLNEDYADGDIRFIVTSSGKSSTYYITADYISVADSSIVIYKPFTPSYGEQVYLEINEGVFLDDFDNPNGVIESGIDGIANDDDAVTEVGWFMSYGYSRDLVIGTYLFSGTSYWEGSDESFEVEITADPSDESKVIINGFYGSTTPIPATFDGNFGTLTVNCEEDYLLGDLFADGGETYFWSYGETEFVVNVSSSGDMVTGSDYWLALYWVAADGSAEGYQNIFTASTWTKSASSSANKSATILTKHLIPSNLERK
jgi:hypothetical protein